MVIEPGSPVLVPADPLVRRVREDEIDILLPACVAMFTEEVGVSPLAGGGADPYRARIAELVRAGRAFARIESGRVLTKAEVGAVGDGVCQVQGVWTTPELRGHGFGLAAMAQVVELARDITPVVSLYVNDFNVVARHVYERVGFHQSTTFSTVLF
jgi:predicted GNAT family acetyltransferase